MNYYIVFDGRAAYNEDDASVLDTIGEAKKEDAISEFKRDWADFDAVLFEYDVDGESLSNGRQVFV